MADKPTKLSRKEWHDAKAVTLKSTKLGEALGAWEAAWAKCEGPPERSYAAFAGAIKALNDVKTKVEEAKKVCNKTLHKSTLVFLDGYAALIGKAETTLKHHKLKYDGYVKDWKDIRVRTKAAMVKAEQDMDKLVRKADAVVKTCEQTAKVPNSPNRPKSVALGKTMLAELAQLQKATNDALSEARVPKAATVSPHKDDFPDDARNLFDECRQIQESIIGKRSAAEADVRAAMKKCGG